MEPNKPSLEGEPLSVSNLRSTCKKAGNIIWPLDLWADEAHELLTHVDRLTTQLKNVKEDRELAMEAVETLRQERDRLTARVRELEAADRESHDLCCRLAEKIGIERSHRESLQCEVERLTKENAALRDLLNKAGGVVKLTATDWAYIHPDGSSATLTGVEDLLRDIDAAVTQTAQPDPDEHAGGNEAAPKAQEGKP